MCSQLKNYASRLVKKVRSLHVNREFLIVLIHDLHSPIISSEKFKDARGISPSEVPGPVSEIIIGQCRRKHRTGFFSVKNKRFS